MAINPKSLENLKKFEPGKVSNPKGRPKGSLSLVTILKEKLAEIPAKDNEQKRTNAQILIQKAFDVATKKGDVAMIKDMLDRIDGKPKASVDLTSGGEKMLGIAALFDASAKEDEQV